MSQVPYSNPNLRQMCGLCQAHYPVAAMRTVQLHYDGDDPQQPVPFSFTVPACPPCVAKHQAAERDNEMMQV